MYAVLQIIRVNESALQERILALLEKLAQRARDCPGISPVDTEEDLRALAQWHAGADDRPAALANSLEILWRHPDEAALWVNRLLLESGVRPPLGTVAGHSASDPAWKAALRAALHPRPFQTSRAMGR
jgi:hypothetical protein